MFKKLLCVLSVLTSVAWYVPPVSRATTPCTPTGVCTPAKRAALLCAQTPNGIVLEICTDARGQVPINDLDNDLTTFAAAVTVPAGVTKSIGSVNWSIDGNCGFSGNDITSHVGSIQVMPPGVGGSTNWLKGEFTREAVVIPLVLNPGDPTRVIDMVFGPPLGGGPKKPVKVGPSSVVFLTITVNGELKFLDGPVLGPVCGGSPITIKTVAQSYRRTDSQGNQFQIDVTFDESGRVVRVIKSNCVPSCQEPQNPQDITGLGFSLSQALLNVSDGKGLQPIKDLPDGTAILSGVDSSCALFLGGRFYVFC